MHISDFYDYTGYMDLEVRMPLNPPSHSLIHSPTIEWSPATHLNLLWSGRFVLILRSAFVFIWIPG